MSRVRVTFICDLLTHRLPCVFPQPLTWVHLLGVDLGDARRLCRDCSPVNSRRHGSAMAPPEGVARDPGLETVTGYPDPTV